jgi:hypothetical protein
MVPILEKGNKHGLKASRGGPGNGQEIYIAFSPEREDPGNTTVARRVGLDPQATEMAAAALRNHLHRAGVVASGGGDDQAAGEHLPLREYRAGQRVEAAFAPHGPRHLGGDCALHLQIVFAAFSNRGKNGSSSLTTLPRRIFYPGPGLPAQGQADICRAR